MAIKMPPSMGGPVQAVKPLPDGLDGAPMTIGVASNTSTAGAAAEALYVVANVNCYFRLDGAVATANDALLPAYIPMVLSCNVGDRISVLRETGDGLLHVHDVETL